MEVTFYTVGYGGKDMGSFVSLLEANGIDVVVDVREYPMSRKKGFSKKALSFILDECGIEYWHFRELGSPKELRKKFYQDGDFDYFKEQFKARFPDRRDTLKDLLKQTATKNLCLMCFEADWEGCHRGLIAEEIISLNGGETSVVHL